MQYSKFHNPHSELVSNEYHCHNDDDDNTNMIWAPKPTSAQKLRKDGAIKSEKDRRLMLQELGGFQSLEILKKFREDKLLSDEKLKQTKKLQAGASDYTDGFYK